ncbi:hypothetical protein SVAN01_08103 [Stagonosporopsis vannaccii]|nr:hypothetical protein SVAN01_08103 [Stagonosporopsis vannaccii]
MPNPPPSPLPRFIQLAINATNLPFPALSYILTPLIHALCSTNQLAHQLCNQHHIFLCIFLLHLWQLFKFLPPIRSLARHCYRIDTTSNKHADAIHRIALLTFVCSPACAVLGALITVAYFALKRRKYGKYCASMRRFGKGYYADPRDLMNWRRVGSEWDAVDRLRA